MADSVTEARRRQSARLEGADATLRAYATDLANFEAWCARHGFTAMPATPEVGCGEEVVTPIGPIGGRADTASDGSITPSPSFRNYSIACRSHYWIRDSHVLWA